MTTPAKRDQFIDLHAIRARCERSREFGAVINWTVGEFTRPTKLRREIASDAAVLGLELHGAVWLLVQSGHYAAAHALLRPMMETTTRALWLLYSASFGEIEGLVAGTHTNTLASMLRVMKKNGAFPEIEILCTLDEQGKKIFHSFTHGGYELLRRRADGYEPQEILNCLLIADLYLMIAADAASVLFEAPLLKSLVKEVSKRVVHEQAERFGVQPAEPSGDGLPQVPDWKDPR